MLKKLRKLVAGIVLASLSVGLFPVQVSATSYTVVRDIKASLAAGSGILTASNAANLDASSGITVATWAKFIGPAAAGNLWQFTDDSANVGIRLTWETSTNKLFTWQYDSGGVGSLGYKTTSPIPTNTWLRVLVTYNGSGKSEIFINGTSWGSGTGNVVRSTTKFGISPNANGGQYFSDTCVWKRVLSASEISADYYNFVRPTTNLSLRWPLQEGANTTINDVSGNGLGATITSPTWSSDTPSKPYSLVNPNLVKNGNFEYAPPFVAATNNSNKYIDGTAAGSTTNDLFKMYLVKNGVAGDSEAQFDSSVKYSGSNSLKISVKTANKYAQVFINATTYYQAGTNPALPSTSYTYSFWMKTNYVSGDSNDGASIMFNFAKADGTSSGSFQSTKVKTTTDWTLYTGTFTTAADTVAINVNPRLYGHTGTATLIMDAWFDDIVLTPTTAYQTQNALLYSQDFTNAAWSKINNTPTATTTVADPFGGTGTTLMTEAADGSPLTHVLRQTTNSTIGKIVTFSVFLKAKDRSWGAVYSRGGGVGEYVNLSTCQNATKGGATYINAGTEQYPNGWCRGWVTFVDDGGGHSIYMANADGGATYQGDGTSGIYVYGAQVDLGTQMTPYRRVNDRPYGLSGMSTMAQSQNLIYPSQNFGSTWTQSNVTVSSADTIAPDGTQTADTITVNTTAYAAVSRSVPVTTNPNGTYTLSFWVKAGTTSSPYFGIYDGSTWVGSSQSATIVSGPGSLTQITGNLYSVTGLSSSAWTRVSVTRTGFSSSSLAVYIYPDTNGSGTAGHSIKLWGAQFVQGNWAGPYKATTSTIFNEGNFYNVVAQQQNLITYSDPSAIGNFTSSGGSTSVSSFAWPSNTTPGLAYAASYGNNAVIRYTYFSNTFIKGQTYTLSFYVSMDDGSTPVVTTNSAGCDLLPVIETTAIDNINNRITVTPIGYGVSKVTATYTATGSGGFYVGVIKYTTMSAKTFKASGFQLVQANWSPPLKATSGTPYNIGNIYNLAY